MSHRTCVSDQDEKLYTLEVFIEYVSMYPEKLYKIAPNELGIDLQFTDMPLFRIFQSGFVLTKPDRSKEITRESGMVTVYFNAGKMYLFTKHPGTLIEMMREKPILLDLYKIKEIKICPEEVVKEPLGHSTIPLAGCLCDHMMMASNDIYHLPKMYEIKNTYGLIDDEYKPSGYVSLCIRLTCFHTYMIVPYSLVQHKLLFRNAGSFNEFLCTKILYPDEEERRAAEASERFCLPEKDFGESELDTPARPGNIFGLVFVCGDLALRDGYPPNVVHPNYPLQIPAITIEEIPFDVERARRKGFEQADDKAPDIVVRSDKACMYIGCTGNICTGKT